MSVKNCKLYHKGQKNNFRNITKVQAYFQTMTKTSTKFQKEPFTIHNCSRSCILQVPTVGGGGGVSGWGWGGGRRAGFWNADRIQCPLAAVEKQQKKINMIRHGDSRLTSLCI